MIPSADLTYSAPDGIWTRFYAESPAGVEAFNIMAAAMPDGIVAFLPGQVADVLRQLRAAGLTVRKATPAKPMSADEVDALLAELAAVEAPEFVPLADLADWESFWNANAEALGEIGDKATCEALARECELVIGGGAAPLLRVGFVA